MVGQLHFKNENVLINARLAEVGTLIVVHRGTGNMSIAENTVDGVVAALASGGDMVEIDVSESTDGDFFTFHDGNELRLLGIDKNMLDMSTAEIQAAHYLWASRPNRIVRVDPLPALLENFKGETLFNIDRGWKHYPRLLPQLAQLNMTPQLLIKAPASNPESIEVLRASKVKFPFMPICCTLEEAERYLDDPNLNTVGLELIAENLSSPLASREILLGLKARRVFTCVNAEVLNTGTDLWLGYDDAVSILRDPELGWGKLFEFEPDAIITDWPWALHAYRQRRLAYST